MAPKSSLDREYDVRDEAAPSAYQREIYGAFRKPAISTKFSEWERLAKLKLPEGNYNYVHDSAGMGTTCQANVEAFRRYKLKPAALVNATRRDLSVKIFGTTLSSPIMCAPVGVQNIMHTDAEEATARACEQVDVPMILSTAATRTVEQVASANGAGQRWYQLYWPKPQDEEITVSLLRRARASGYTVLVVTIDTFDLGWRPADLDNSYLPFIWGDGCQIGHSDPVFNARYDAQVAADARPLSEKIGEAWELLRRPGTMYGALQLLLHAKRIKKSQAWLNVMNSGTYRTWPDLELLKRYWDGPIVLKGIQTVEDAQKAIEYGMSGIIVSNHGGRQLDGAIASLDALAAIGNDGQVKEAIKQHEFTLLFDSGIRTGTDVLKALCLGAKAVLIARPFMYGLAIGGQKGVEHVFKCLKGELDNQLGNMGKTSVKELGRSDLEIWEKAML